MYALGKIARGGATRGGYVGSHAFIAIDGTHVGFGGTPGSAHVGTIIESLSITDELNESPNTCQFRVNGMVPNAGAEVRVLLGSKNAGAPMFAGFALTVAQRYAAGKPANVQADVHCVDYTWLFGFVQLTKAYRNQSASTIAADLVATYAAANGFTGAGIVKGLPTIDQITFTNEQLDQAMTRLARRIGAYWYVDYQKAVHFFIDETTNGAPETLTPNHKSLADFQRSADRTQVLTRCYVEGRGTTILGAVAVGDTKIPVDAIDMFVVAADVFAKLSPHGSDGGAQLVTFAGVVPGQAGSLVGPGVGPPGAPTLARAAGTGLGAGTYKYAYTDVTPAGETLPSPLATIDVGAPLAPPTAPPTATLASYPGGIDVGSHNYAYTYLTPGGETTGSPLVQITTQAPLNTGVPALSLNQRTGGPLQEGYWYSYRLTLVDANGGESLLTNANNTYQIWVGNGYGHFRVTVDNLPQPGITALKLYRSHGSPNNSIQTGPWYYVDTVPTGGNYGGIIYDDFVAEGNLGGQPPTTNNAFVQLRQVTIKTPAGPDPIISGVKIYRTPANTTLPYLLVAQVNGGQGAATYVDTKADAALGPQAPYVNTSGDGLRNVQVSNIAPGPAPTIARQIYRTAANGSQLRLVGYFGDNTTTAYTDTSPDSALTANAPTSDTSGLQQVPGQVPAGSVSIVIANAGPFEATGGWAVIGNGEQTIRYQAKTGNALTGVPAAGIGAIVAAVAYNSTITAAPMLTGVPAAGVWSIREAINAGDDVNVVVQRDNTARQSDVAAMVHVGPGIRDTWVQDRRLSVTEARARGDATLALRPLEDVTVTYTCRDLRTASGKSITVNLPAPTNVTGTFKIQSVVINKFRPFANQYPTFAVTASSNQFSFEDWLRRMETKA